MVGISFSSKYVQKLTLSALRAADQVNVSVSSIFTVVSRGSFNVRIIIGSSEL
jgi:hypothetical protein